MNGPVDVLKILDLAAEQLSYDGHRDLIEARAAVAELIEADVAYDTTRSRHTAAFKDGPHGDLREQREAQAMLNAARDRRADSIARVKGGAA